MMKKASVLFAVLCTCLLVVTLVFTVAPNAQAEESNVITVAADGTKVTISENGKILNLNGKKNVVVEFANNVELSVIDTAFMDKDGNVTDLTGASAGSLTVTGEGTIMPVSHYDDYRYLAVADDGIYSFHPFNFAISKTGINTKAGAVCLQATFIANDVVKGLVTDYGIKNQTLGVSVSAKERYGFGAVNGFHAYFDLVGSFESEKLTSKNDFCAYIAVGDKTISGIQNVKIVPQDILGKIDAVYDGYSVTDQAKIQDMIQRNSHLTEVPAVANIVRRVTLPADKATVQNMNKVLSLFVNTGRPQHFGTAMQILTEYGYGDDYIPKTRDYKFYWYAEKNVVFLADAENTVIYPEAYVGTDASDLRKYFDLTLPTIMVIKSETPDFANIDGVGELNLALKYIFVASQEEYPKYNEWNADFYVSVDLPEGKEFADLVLTGQYDAYGPQWSPLILPDVQEGISVPLLKESTGRQITYHMLQNIVQEFKCGVIYDEQYTPLYEMVFGDYDDPAGAKMTVELRLTNPDEPTECIILGIVEYTFGGSDIVETVDEDVTTAGMMNAVLLSQEKKPQNIEDVKKCLGDSQYIDAEDFVPKAEGRRFLWDSQDNVILLVDEKNEVIYPAAYLGIDASDSCRYFDLSVPEVTDIVPTITIIKSEDPGFANIDGVGELDLALKYIFIASKEETVKYNEWNADFYVSLDLPEGKEMADLVLAGQYDAYGPQWSPLILPDVTEDVSVPLLKESTGRQITYHMLQNIVQEFQCGVIYDEQYTSLYEMVFGTYDNPAGSAMRVELRLTNPEDPSDILVLGVCHYTFQ